MATRVFAFIVGDEVFGTLTIPDTAPNYDRLVAGLSSAPIVVESTDTEGVAFGWTYDGNSFIAPGK